MLDFAIEICLLLYIREMREKKEKKSRFDPDENPSSRVKMNKKLTG